MLLPGHLAGGYLVTHEVLKLLGTVVDPYEVKKFLIVGALIAVLPDLDFLYFFAKERTLKLKENASHRIYISHAPLLWLIVSAVFFIAGQPILGFIVWFSSWSHFVFDSIEYGIMWLWPFSKRRFSLRKTTQEEPQERNLGKYYWIYFSKIYLGNMTFYVEVIVIALALFVMLK